MARRKRDSKRTRSQAEADRQADALVRDLGRALREARQRRGLTQADAAAMAGLSLSTWSYLEIAGDGRTTIATWNRAATALGSRVSAYVREVSAATMPRDAVHLRNQELVMRVAGAGGWRSRPEVPIDRDTRSSRMADVLLNRRTEYALCEIFDWFDDVGAAGRDWRRRLDAVDRYATARMSHDTLPRASGVWIVRATRRNRQLVRDHRLFFRALLSGSSSAWLGALKRPDAPMPPEPALIWVTVAGDRLFPARLG